MAITAFISSLKNYKTTKKLVKPVLFFVGRSTAAVQLGVFGERISQVGLLIAALLGLYLGSVFWQVVTCDSGFVGCTLQGFGIIFPLYLLTLGFTGALNFVWFYGFFFLSSLLYLYAGYSIGAFGELWFKRRRMSYEHS